MDEKYTVVGRVEIGTDEYRDLIESVLRKDREASENRNQYWTEQAKVKELTKELAATKEQLELYKLFITENTLAKNFSIWKAERLEKDCD